MIQSLDIQLVSRSYPVFIGVSLLHDQTLLREHIYSQQVMIVTDTQVAPLYLERLQSAFLDRQCDVIILPPGESSKTAVGLQCIYDALIEKNHHRDTTIVALGGGVIGDMAGFAASTYQRGVHFIQIPTTLLAQVDAAIGGKTAINHQQSKNMIGTFYQPNAVFMDIDTLASLSPRAFRAGFGEVIKYALLEGGCFPDMVREYLSESKGNLVQSQALVTLIRACCEAKMTYVQLDEREAGRRALLNLGHTFAHALETVTHYERWLHGEAVAIGLHCAVLLSHVLGRCDEKTVNEVRALLVLAQLPTHIPREISLTELMQCMKHDKKIKNNQMRFVVLIDIGECDIESEVDELSLMTALMRAQG